MVRSRSPGHFAASVATSVSVFNVLPAEVAVTVAVCRVTLSCNEIAPCFAAAAGIARTSHDDVPSTADVSAINGSFSPSAGSTRRIVTVRSRCSAGPGGTTSIGTVFCASSETSAAWETVSSGAASADQRRTPAVFSVAQLTAE